MTCSLKHYKEMAHIHCKKYANIDQLLPSRNTISAVHILIA